MKLLVLQHVPHEHPGYIKNYADDHKIGLDVIELWKPYKIPALDDYQAVVIMGGPMGVYENYPSEADELKLIGDAIAIEKPVIGFCLGGQLLAHALGADVHPNVRDGKKVKEVGYFTVDLTEEGRKGPVLAGFGSRINVLEWHGDAFELPKGAKLLATSPLCRNQAFSFGNVYGFLFHFEFTPEMIARQIEVDKEWMHADNSVNEEKLLAQAGEYASLMKKQAYLLLDNFLSLP